jgi:2-methylaconitate cis-trans-isomerase PrpF
VNAEAIGYTGTELQDAINSDPKALAMFETIRAHGAVRMGLIKHIDEIASRQHTPKVAFVAKPAAYVASSGKQVAAQRRRPAGARDVDGQAAPRDDGHGGGGDRHGRGHSGHAGESRRRRRRKRDTVRFGHPSGTLRVGAQASLVEGQWKVTKAIMSRSARVLMEGWVRVPGDSF